ncbi:DUF547 domain-containing protein [Vibrio sp.]|nr:DUF547 domain-containing protein [Vibrio sp.]
MKKTLLSTSLTILSFSAFSAPKADLWPYWDKNNDTSSTTISHQTWQSLLDRYLIKEGENTLFDYDAVTDEDQKILDNYLKDLTSLNPLSYSKEEQFAYWVNLYNSLTVDLILENYPIKSIRKIGGFFGSGPWNDEITEINNKELTLNDIEHRILRPIWKDERIHYAVNCASYGCPNLHPMAFTSDNTEKLLEESAVAFINSDKGVLIKGGNVQLSTIFDWYSVDFGKNEKEVLQYLSKYKEELKYFHGDISYEYNWDLNQPQK